LLADIAISSYKSRFYPYIDFYEYFYET